ncbi:hypothetical protein [Sodalis-like endosymbiont of Proechinophthirus fluctus]
MIWIDAITKFPLPVDLLDHDGEALE